MLDGLLLRVVHSHIMPRRWMPTRVLCVVSSRLSWLKRPSKSSSQVRSTLPRDSGASDGHGEGGASREGSPIFDPVHWPSATWSTANKRRSKSLRVSSS